MSNYGFAVGAFYIGLCAVVPGVLAEAAVAAYRKPGCAWTHAVGAMRYTFWILAFYCGAMLLAQSGLFPLVTDPIGSLFGHFERAVGCTDNSYTQSLFVPGGREYGRGM